MDFYVYTHGCILLSMFVFYIQRAAMLYELDSFKFYMYTYFFNQIFILLPFLRYLVYIGKVTLYLKYIKIFVLHM